MTSESQFNVSQPIDFKDPKYFNALTMMALNCVNDVNILLAIQCKYNILRSITTHEQIIHDLGQLFNNDIQLFLQLLSEKAMFGYTG